MSEVIVITSGKGGVGKTTTTANIGAALALSGKKVVMIDTDIGLRNLDVIMGVENRIVYDLVDVVENRAPYSKALVRDKRYEGLFLLPAAQSRDKSAVTTTQMKHLIRQMEDSFDYILIDCPAGIEQGFENAVAAAKKAIVVAMPEVSSVRDADRIIGLLEKHDISDIKLVINKLRPKMVENGSMLGIEDMLDILAINLIGVVPDDEDIIVAANKGEYVSAMPSSNAGQAYRNIASRLNGEEVELMKFKKSFFEKLFAKRRRTTA
ncbi:MAG: septum site-determining protein MinD [Clostridia bacterium]|nr:septum site-determining protein MinD [Clostridia bacterium]